MLSWSKSATAVLSGTEKEQGDCKAAHSTCGGSGWVFFLIGLNKLEELKWWNCVRKKLVLPDLKCFLQKCSVKQLLATVATLWTEHFHRTKPEWMGGKKNLFLDNYISVTYWTGAGFVYVTISVPLWWRTWTVVCCYIYYVWWVKDSWRQIPANSISMLWGEKTKTLEQLSQGTVGGGSNSTIVE